MIPSFNLGSLDVIRCNLSYDTMLDPQKFPQGCSCQLAEANTGRNSSDPVGNGGHCQGSGGKLDSGEYRIFSFSSCKPVLRKSNTGEVTSKTRNALREHYTRRFRTARVALVVQRMHKAS